MKKTIAMLVYVLVSSSALANDTIKQDMKQIGTLFKQIGSTMNDVTKDAANATASSQIATLLQNATTQEPDAIQKLPADQQSAALADYRSMLTQESNLASTLAKDFAAHDNAAVAAVLQQMSDLKQEGHNKYNPSFF